MNFDGIFTMVVSEKSREKALNEWPLSQAHKFHYEPWIRQIWSSPKVGEPVEVSRSDPTISQKINPAGIYAWPPSN